MIRKFYTRCSLNSKCSYQYFQFNPFILVVSCSVVENFLLCRNNCGLLCPLLKIFSRFIVLVFFEGGLFKAFIVKCLNTDRYTGKYITVSTGRVYNFAGNH